MFLLLRLLTCKQNLNTLLVDSSANVATEDWDDCTFTVTLLETTSALAQVGSRSRCSTRELSAYLSLSYQAEVIDAETAAELLRRLPVEVSA